MTKALFLNGHYQQVAEIFTGLAPQGYEPVVKPADVANDQKIEWLKGVEYLVLLPATLPGEIIRQAPSLKFIQLLTAGYDKVDLKTAAELGIPVATNGGANAWAVAEHAVALVLALYKKLVALDASTKAGTWRKPSNGFNIFELSGKTVGIIGAGNIGRKVATRLKAFETDIVYLDQGPVKELDETLGARLVTLDELVRVSDVITLHAPLLESTRGMIGEAQLRAMKPGTVIINTSRAELIDENALVAALREGVIAGAGLDVYNEEPAKAGHPLFALDNVIATPHTAGHSYEGWARRCRTAWSNIQKVAAGQAPDFVVRG